MACRPYNTGRCLLLRLFNPSKLWGSLQTCLMGNADGSIFQERYLQVFYSFRQRVWKLGCLHWRSQVDDALDIVPLAEFGAFGWCEYAEFATTQKQPLGNNIIYFTKVS